MLSDKISLCAFSVRTILADPNRGEIKKMQNRRKSSRRRTSVRQRRFSAVEKRIIIPLEKSDRISSAFTAFALTKSLSPTFIRFFDLRFFSLSEPGRDKIVWSTRFRRARRTSVRRAAKSGAEKAKTFNFMQESVRIPTHFPSCGTYKRLIRSACFRFFDPDDFSLPERLSYCLFDRYL